MPSMHGVNTQSQRPFNPNPSRSTRGCVLANDSISADAMLGQQMMVPSQIWLVALDSMRRSKSCENRVCCTMTWYPSVWARSEMAAARAAGKIRSKSATVRPMTWVRPELSWRALGGRDDLASRFRAHDCLAPERVRRRHA